MTIFSQENPTEPNNPNSTCNNFNGFLDDSELTSHFKYHTENGLISLNKAISNDIVDFNSMRNYINLDPNITFVEKSEKPSRSIDNTKFVNYDQYYKGVEVEDAGVTEWVHTGGGGGGEPCFDAYTSAISVHIVDDLDLDVNPNLPDSEIEDIIGVSEYTSILVIRESLDCEMKLSYRVDYYDDIEDEELSLISWLDANSGEIIETISNAATSYYDFSNNENYDPIENNNLLSSAVMCDGPIFIYEAFSCPIGATAIQAATEDGGVGGLNTKPICPIEPNTEAETLFNILQNLSQAYEAFGLTFPAIHAVTNCNGRPLSMNGDNDEAYLSVPIDAIDCEILAHELFHSLQFQNNIISLWPLQEGFADIFGIYFGAVCNNNQTNWIIGDGTPYQNRDLMNPPQGKDCVNNGPINQYQDGILNIHEYGRALGHWFYLVSEGAFSQGLGSDKVMNMILDFLALSDGETHFHLNDYEDFMEIMLELIIQSEGYCSDAHKNFISAFEAICLQVTNSQKCHFNITGPLSVCEEQNSLTLSINSYFTERYRWDYPHDWTIQNGTGNSNSYNNSRVLKVTQFPPGNYPQNVSICATGKTSGHRTCITVKIKDCDNSTPCQQNRKSQDTTNKSETNFVRVFSISGVELYTGIPLNQLSINNSNNFPNGLLIISSYNEDGNLINSEKIVKTNY